MLTDTSDPNKGPVFISNSCADNRIYTVSFLSCFNNNKILLLLKHYQKKVIEIMKYNILSIIKTIKISEL